MNVIEEFEFKSTLFPIMKDQQLLEFTMPNLNTIHEINIHSIDEPLTIILWRKTSSDKLSLSINFELTANLYTDDDTDWSVTHKHDFIELTYVAKGELNQLIAGQKYTFVAGDVCIIDRNSEHADSARDQDNFMISICMKEEFFDELFISEIEEDEFQKFIRTALLKQKSFKQFLKFTPRGKENVLFPIIEQVAKEKKENRKGSSHIIKGLMIRIFELLTKHYELSLNETQSKKMNQLLFVKVEEYLRKHYKDASIKELVIHFHFQEDYFTRLIKKQTGMSFSQFLRHIRLSKAVELLLNTNLPVNQIIETVGYENRYHFYTLFKEQYGMTPKEFRQTRGISNP